MKARTPRKRGMGQALVEYILVVCLFAIPISLYFTPKLMKVLQGIFNTIKMDLTAAGI